MDHHDHVNLLRKGISQSGGVWADFGSGRGAFTLALAELLGPGGVVFSVDKDKGSLHPFSFAIWQTIARRCAFKHTELLATAPSSFLGEFYSAGSW